MLQCPPCVWWCSGGLFKLLDRKIISPNNCDALSRWRIIKQGSLFPFMLWLISTCWGYISYLIRFDTKLFFVGYFYSRLVNLWCLKIPVNIFLFIFQIQHLETSDLEQICNQSKSAGEAPKRNMHNCIQTKGWDSACCPIILNNHISKASVYLMQKPSHRYR